MLIVYSLHLDTRSSPPDAKWRDLIKTVRLVTTNVLNVFSLANQKLRADKRDASSQEVFRYWKYAEELTVSSEQLSVINGGEYLMNFIEELAKKYRQFYRVSEDDLGNVYYQESSHSILRPISIALDVMLSSSSNTDKNTLINFGSGEIRNALERLKGKEISRRILRKNKSQELYVIKEFMEFCVEEILGNEETKQGYCKGDRALLQENRNRIKSGAEFAYRWLALQDAEKSQSETV